MGMQHLMRQPELMEAQKAMVWEWPHYTYRDMNNGYREYHFEGGEDMDDILKHIFGGSGAFHRGTANGSG